jgi:L-fuconolactonase
MKIDTHIHAWQPSRRNDDILGFRNFPDLEKDAMPNDVEGELQAQGIHSAVLVQSAPSIDHGNWCLDVAEANDFIVAVMAWIDPCDPALTDVLAAYISRPKLAGFRVMLNRTPDLSIVSSNSFVRGIQTIVDHGLAIELLVVPEQLEAATTLVNLVGRGRFVLDHCGQPDLKQGDLTKWKADLAALGRSGDVTCKLSGLAERVGKGWEPSQLIPVVDSVLQVFPADRLMFATNWPVCDLVGGMGLWCDGLDQVLDSLALTREERDSINYRTAQSVFGLLLV